MNAIVCHPGPQYSVADVHNGWVRGLRALGVHVREFNLQDRLAFYASARVEDKRAFKVEDAVHLAIKGLEAACYETWPDVVILISGFFLDEYVCQLMRARGHKVVIVHTESPYEDDRQVARCALADLNVINDPTNLELYPAGTIWLPHCYDPAVHYPRPAVAGYESEFFFAGTGYPSRVAFFEQVDFTGIHAVLDGNWQGLAEDSPLRDLMTTRVDDCLDNAETVLHYVSTLTSVNVYRHEADRPELALGWAMGPREVELAACRTFFLRDPRGEGDDVFPMLPTFSGPGDFADQLRWWLANPDARQDAALKAHEAIADRTFDRNASELLTRLGL